MLVGVCCLPAVQGFESDVPVQKTRIDLAKFMVFPGAEGHGTDRVVREVLRRGQSSAEGQAIHIVLIVADDGVAVLSIAMKRDLFAWFRPLGITVERTKA